VKRAWAAMLVKVAVSCGMGLNALEKSSIPVSAWVPLLSLVLSQILRSESYIVWPAFVRI